jgi:predicted RNA-binding protein associated with RNAse of E/G family
VAPVAENGSTAPAARAGRPARVAMRDTGFAPVPALLCGSVLCCDHRGMRYFWLLDGDVQLLYEPYGWSDEWYVDVVAISADRDVDRPSFTVVDRHLDLIVRGDGSAYRMLGLDAAADALAAGELTADQLAATLRAAQWFLDRYVHRGAPFPPPALRPLLSVPSAG